MSVEVNYDKIESQNEMEDFLGGSINEVRANSSLRKDEYKQMDEQLSTVVERQLSVVEYLRDQGLVQPVDNIGITNLQFEKQSDMRDAEAGMTADAGNDVDTVDFSLHNNPVPFLWADFKIRRRRLVASRNGVGQGLDDSQSTIAGRKIGNKAEDLVVQGDSNIAVDGNSLEGLMNHTDVLTPSTSGDWGGTPTNIWQDVDTLFDAIENQTDDESDDVGFEGPFAMFTSRQQWSELREIDPEGDGNLVVRDRIENDFAAEIDNLDRTSALNDGEAVVFQPTEDIAQIAMAQDVTTVFLEDKPTKPLKVRAFAVMGPYIKGSDYDGVSGIAKATNL